MWMRRLAERVVLVPGSRWARKVTRKLHLSWCFAADAGPVWSVVGNGSWARLTPAGFEALSPTVGPASGNTGMIIKVVLHSICFIKVAHGHTHTPCYVVNCRLHVCMPSPRSQIRLHTQDHKIMKDVFTGTWLPERAAMCVPDRNISIH